MKNIFKIAIWIILAFGITNAEDYDLENRGMDVEVWRNDYMCQPNGYNVNILFCPMVDNLASVVEIMQDSSYKDEKSQKRDAKEHISKACFYYKTLDKHNRDLINYLYIKIGVNDEGLSIIDHLVKDKELKEICRENM